MDSDKGDAARSRLRINRKRFHIDDLDSGGLEDALFVFVAGHDLVRGVERAQIDVMLMGFVRDTS